MSSPCRRRSPANPAGAFAPLVECFLRLKRPRTPLPAQHYETHVEVSLRRKVLCGSGSFGDNPRHSNREAEKQKQRPLLPARLLSISRSAILSFRQVTVFDRHSPDGHRFEHNWSRFGVFASPDRRRQCQDMPKASRTLKLPNFLSPRRTSPVYHGTCDKSNSLRC